MIFSGGSGELPQIEGDTQDVNSVASRVEKPEEKPKVNYYAEYTDNTQQIASDVASGSIIVVNCDTNEVVAARNATERCYPASTTKIMTILTAVDYITDYDKMFTFSYEITDPFHKQGATMAGFANEEAANMTDLILRGYFAIGRRRYGGACNSGCGQRRRVCKAYEQKGPGAWA